MLYFLYSSDFSTLNQFTTYMKNTKLFPAGQHLYPLPLQQFNNLMTQQEFVFVEGAALRKEFTYYVLQQR